MTGDTEFMKCVGGPLNAKMLLPGDTVPYGGSVTVRIDTGKRNRRTSLPILVAATYTRRGEKLYWTEGRGT